MKETGPLRLSGTRLPPACLCGFSPGRQVLPFGLCLRHGTLAPWRHPTMSQDVISPRGAGEGEAFGWDFGTRTGV